MYLILVDMKDESELSRMEVVSSETDVHDHVAMAALGRKLVKWVEETKAKKK